VCDTLCLLRPKGAIFAKNSDRPVTETQLLRAYPARKSGGVLETQYLSIDDLGAVATVLSQPSWLWGAEHGVNSHHVAIGNEKVYGVTDPGIAPDALIGMDLVRLGLERGRSAQEAVDVMTQLLERHGQGGAADSSHDEAYWSSFLIVDPTAAWILETCGSTWAAKPVGSSAAISNRLTIRTDWTRASADVEPGADFDVWRDPVSPTGHADKRLVASRKYLAAAEANAGLSDAGLSDAGLSGLRQAVGHLRDHGSGPWGSPGGSGEVSELPAAAFPDGTGVTVCMHVRGYMTTTSSLVAELPEDPDLPVRASAAIGSPCASVYIPFVVPSAPYGGQAPIAGVLSDNRAAAGFAALRSQVETTPGSLKQVRRVLDDLEADLWDEAGSLGGEISEWEQFAVAATARTTAALDAIGAGRAPE